MQQVVHLFMEQVHLVFLIMFHGLVLYLKIIQNTDMEYLLHGVEHMSEERAKEIVAKIASMTDVAVKRG